jgi:hypothetical protein
MTEGKAGTWLSYCDASIKFEYLNDLFSLGSSSQSHDDRNDEALVTPAQGKKRSRSTRRHRRSLEEARAHTVAPDGEGVRMKGIKTGVLGLALSSFIGNAWAAEVCARIQDLTALQVAAVQQQLMVAAFTCKHFGLYNSFVVTYQADLQNSDRTLQDFFLRLNAGTGTADYHTFKTKLANSYSLRSSGNEKAYCGTALRVFHAALNEGKKSLAEFVMAQPVSYTASYDSCGERIQGGAMMAQVPSPPAPPVAAVITTAVAETAVVGNAGVASAAAATTPSVLPAKPEAGNSQPAANGKSLSTQSGNVYSARNSSRYAPPPPPPPRQRRYDARDYRDYPTDSYGYSTRYGDRDPYYRNPYARYWYGTPPQYYNPGRP